MKKRIYLMFEVKKRELEARLYFALVAALKDYSIVVGNKADIWARRNLLRPGIVIFKSLGPGNIDMVNDCIKAGHEVVAWDEESLVTPAQINYFIKRRISKECLKNIRYFFSWGEIEKDYLSEEFKEFKNKIVMTGNTRIDLFNKNNIKIFEKEADKIKKKYGDFCLLFGNFGKVNNASLKDENEYIENVIKEGTLKRNSDEHNYVKNNLLVQKKIFSKIPSLIESFSKNFPDKKLIVRPHPVESKEIYLKITKDLKNVKVVFDDTNAISWIKAADFSISSNCTTAVESYLCNKLSINFWPFNDDMETYSYHLPLKVALQGNSPDQVISQIKNIYEKNNFDISNYLNLNLVNDHLKKSFFNFRNNKCSVSEVLNYVNKIDIMTERDDKNTGFLYFYYYHLRTIFKKIIFTLIQNFRNKQSKAWKQYIRQKNKGLNFKEVKTKSLILKELNNLKSKNLVVKEIIPRIFKIEEN